MSRGPDDRSEADRPLVLRLVTSLFVTAVAECLVVYAQVFLMGVVVVRNATCALRDASAHRDRGFLFGMDPRSCVEF